MEIFRKVLDLDVLTTAACILFSVIIIFLTAIKLAEKPEFPGHMHEDGDEGESGDEGRGFGDSL